MSWFSHPKLPAPVQAYVDATPKRIGGKRPVEDLHFLVIDAETTGFNVQTDKILSIAAIHTEHGQILLGRSKSWLVFQDHVAVNEAVRVHGILPSDTKNGQPESQVMEELLPELHGTILVGHHVGFDAALLDVALYRRFGIHLRNPILDTASLAMQAIDAFARTGYANQRPPSLDEVCAHCGIAMMDRHTAAGDAYTTAELFLLLCARLRQRKKRAIVAGDLPLTSV
ncbi:hypothetical protein DB347_00745 [Opitutaceae bacterium EW11]|nr:hypothetical protein DB347_00745 [Opitutaceae bacterium EW11]